MNDIRLTPEERDQGGQGGQGSGFSPKDISRGISKGLAESVSNLGQSVTLKGGFVFWTAAIFLLVAVLGCLGLWGYKMSLDRQKENLNQKISELNQTRDVDFEKNLMDLKSKIDGLKNILNNQTYSSNIFFLLEELVVPQVRFASLDSDVSKLTISLGALATSVDALVKQIVVFKNDSRIKTANFTSVSTDNSGQINTTIELRLKSSIIYPK